MRDMPLSRAPHGRLGILGDDAAGPTAIDPIESVWLDRGDDPTYCAGVERDLVRVAVHEADKAPVGHYIYRVGGEQRAAPTRSSGPMQHAGAREVAAAAHHGQARKQLFRITLPEPNRFI